MIHKELIIIYGFFLLLSMEASGIVNHDSGSIDNFFFTSDFDDIISPIFVSDNSTVTPTTGDWFTFIVNVTDNVNVAFVYVEYWFGSELKNNVTMKGSGIYTYDTHVQKKALVELHYIFHAVDPSNNWNQTPERTVMVVDNDPPLIRSDFLSNIGTGKICELRFNISDNINISTVYLEYWFGSEDHTIMLMSGSPLFRHIIDIPVDSDADLHYNVSATDTSGNYKFLPGIVDVWDSILPISDPGPDLFVDEDTTVFFNGSLSSDNIGIVNWTWSFFDGKKVYLHGCKIVYTFAEPGYYRVNLSVRDKRPVPWYETAGFNVTVRDVTPPMIVSEPMEVSEDTLVTFNGSICSDNVAIFNYSWAFVDGIPVTLFGYSPNHIFNDPGTFNITLNVSDASGNWRSSTINVIVGDLTLPVSNAGPDQIVGIGRTVILDGSGSTDNGIIQNYTWTFFYWEQVQVLQGIEVSFKFFIAGTYEIILKVIDTFGNIDKDTMKIFVIDIITVTGIVSDDNGDPVKSAFVLIRAFDGKTYNTRTLTNGSFAIEIPQGPAQWSISMAGYKPISGTATLTALGTTIIDLTNTPLEKEPKKGSILPMIVITVIILAAVFIAIIFFFIFRERRGDPGIIDKKVKKSRILGNRQRTMRKLRERDRTQ